MDETQNPSVVQGSEPAQTPVAQPTPMPIPPPEPVYQTPTQQIPQPPAQNQPIDLSGNKGMAILAYLGILIIVPFVTEAKNDPFVKFHIKQGLVLIITWIAAGILSSILSYMFFAIGGFFLFTLIFPIIYLGLGIINIIGLINAATGKQKELPILGQFAKSFNF